MRAWRQRRRRRRGRPGRPAGTIMHRGGRGWDQPGAPRGMHARLHTMARAAATRRAALTHDPPFLTRVAGVSACPPKKSSRLDCFLLRFCVRRLEWGHGWGAPWPLAPDWGGLRPRAADEPPAACRLVPVLPRCDGGGRPPLPPAAAASGVSLCPPVAPTPPSRHCCRCRFIPAAGGGSGSLGRASLRPLRGVNPACCPAWSGHHHHHSYNLGLALLGVEAAGTITDCRVDGVWSVCRCRAAASRGLSG